ESEMEKQRQRAREAHKSVDVLVSEDIEGADATEFVGYDLALLDDFQATCIEQVSRDGHAFLVFEKSPFYAEMGGQVGDSGTVRMGGQTFTVKDVTKDESGRYLHALGEGMPGEDPVGESAVLEVDLERRLAIHRHHTATHVLHWALRKALGDHVRQAGSLVEPNRLRFDFSHFEGVTAEQIEEIEGLSNERLLANEAVQAYEIPFAEKPDDVVAFFGDKYGDLVRVVDLGGWSKELCGGTHVEAAGEIGYLKVTSESAIAAGTRRIEAVAGTDAHALANERFRQVGALTQALACKPEDLVERFGAFQAKAKELDKKLRAHEQKGHGALADDLVSQAIAQGDLHYLKAIVHDLSPDDLRALAAQVNKRTAPSTTLLASLAEGKATLVCICSEEAVAQGLNAGDILGSLAERLGGKGGGKPDFAMGGAPDDGSAEKTIADFDFPATPS
ncbi:MAG: DHHA1 domain-containing protein, partial [Opitutales bacterium]